MLNVAAGNGRTRVGFFIKWNQGSQSIEGEIEKVTRTQLTREAG